MAWMLIRLAMEVVGWCVTIPAILLLAYILITSATDTWDQWYRCTTLFILALAFAFASPALAAIPQAEPSAVTDRVDLIETNHLFDDNGKLIFDQLLFWEWDDYKSRHRIVAWRLLKNESMKPRRDYASGRWLAIVTVNDWNAQCRLTEVWASDCRETWTQQDPELLDREHWPHTSRRGLFKPLELRELKFVLKGGE